MGAVLTRPLPSAHRTSLVSHDAGSSRPWGSGRTRDPPPVASPSVEAARCSPLPGRPVTTHEGDPLASPSLRAELPLPTQPALAGRARPVVERAPIRHTRAFSEAFFTYYNHEHRHSGIGLHAPRRSADGTATHVRAQRQVTLDAVYRANLERFTGQRPEALKLRTAETVKVGWPLVVAFGRPGVLLAERMGASGGARRRG